MFLAIISMCTLAKVHKEPDLRRIYAEDRILFEVARLKLSGSPSAYRLTLLDILRSHLLELEQRKKLPSALEMLFYSSQLTKIQDNRPLDDQALANVVNSFEFRNSPFQIVWSPEATYSVSATQSKKYKHFAANHKFIIVGASASSLAGRWENKSHRFSAEYRVRRGQSLAEQQSDSRKISVLARASNATDTSRFRYWYVLDGDFGFRTPDSVPALPRGSLIGLLPPGDYRIWAGGSTVAFDRTVPVSVKVGDQPGKVVEVPYSDDQE